MSEKVLLHVCCANCGAACAERLKNEGYEVSFFYTNSNISPEIEFDKRREDVRRLAQRLSLKLYEDDYDHGSWLESIEGLEGEPEKGARCRACFEHNLSNTARKAEELGMPGFTTTLTVSPHKISETIFEIGSKLDGFLPYNFKKDAGFARSLELSREYEFYRQDYCGCEFSKQKSSP